MIYEVIVTPAAEDDIAEAFAYIQARAPENAERWVRGLYKLVGKLESMPKRCGRAREADDLGLDLRSNHTESSFGLMRDRASCVCCASSTGHVWDFRGKSWTTPDSHRHKSRIRL